METFFICLGFISIVIGLMTLEERRYNKCGKKCCPVIVKKSKYRGN